MYFVALEGVTRYALSEAVKGVMRNKLGHTFFPSPVELRRLCDEAQRPHQEYERRVRLTAEQAREREAWNRTQAERTPESRARVKAMLEHLSRIMPAASKPGEPSVELDPDLVAQVPDAPSTFKRASAA